MPKVCSGLTALAPLHPATFPHASAEDWTTTGDRTHRPACASGTADAAALMRPVRMRGCDGIWRRASRQQEPRDEASVGGSNARRLWRACRSEPAPAAMPRKNCTASAGAKLPTLLPSHSTVRRCPGKRRRHSAMPAQQPLDGDNQAHATSATAQSADMESNMDDTADCACIHTCSRTGCMGSLSIANRSCYKRKSLSAKSPSNISF